MSKPFSQWGLGLLALANSSAAWAQTPGERIGTLSPEIFLQSVLSTLAFGLIGIVLAILGFKIFDALIPFNLEQEICEKQNMAVAVLCGSMVLGICIIVATAIV